MPDKGWLDFAAIAFGRSPDDEQRYLSMRSMPGE
jgi:hypothetical protein